MRKQDSAYKPIWILFALLLGVTAITALSKFASGSDNIPWRTDPSAAAGEARGAGKPVLLYFTASWCGPCQRMKGETWSDAGVEAKLKEYVPVKIDIDHDPATTAQYQVAAVPTMILLDAQGEVTKQITGGMNASEFLAWIGR